MLAAACDADATATGPSQQPTTQRIAVLGDSLAVSPTREESFPSVLEARITKEGLPWSMTNAGVRGDTTAGGLRRLDSVLSEGPRVLIVALGANDGLRGVPIAAIRENLARIIETAKPRNARVLLCGMETPPLQGWNYTLDFHHVFPDLAAEYGTPLVPFLLSGVALNPELNGDDLIHPNAAGARLIANTIWPYLLPILQEETRTALR